MSKLAPKRLLSAAIRALHPSYVLLWGNDLAGFSRGAGDSRDHLSETMQWLKRAHDASGGRGVSGGYSVIDGWLDPYPETTGYIIPTFYDYADLTGENEWRERARAMADWEIEVQMPDGAVQAGLYKGKSAKQKAAVFNTGQVILGWARAYLQTNDERYLNAAKRAGDWLLQAQAEDGAWRFASQETDTDVHTYDVRTAWSLLEIFEITEDNKYADAARANLEWTLQQQTDNGWFENNAFFSTGQWRNPFTHNIAYVMEGLQESHRILGNKRYFEAYSKTAEKLLRIFELRKFMAGDFDNKWKSSRRYSCLTGNAQIAGVWLKHFDLTDDARYLNAALKLNDFTKSAQNVKALHGGIRGGVKGSHPLNGGYTPYIFPNWAAKFFADTLMMEQASMKEFEKQVLGNV